MKLTVLSIGLFFLVVGCAYVPYAREAKKRPREAGVIALRMDHRPEDRQQADSLMASNCGSGTTVKVLEEGEAVVGERSNSTANKGHDDSVGGFQVGGFRLGSRPGESTNTVSETTQLKEWQISYICEPAKKRS